MDNERAIQLCDSNEQLIQKMNQAKLEITERIEERMSDRYELTSQLYYLHCEDEKFRLNINRKQKVLNPLVEALDKLCFANKGSRKSTIGSFSEKEQYNLVMLHFKMLHGSKTRVEEWQILGKINANENRAVGSCSAIRKFDDPVTLSTKISKLKLEKQCENNEGNRKRLEREIEHLEWERGRSIVHAINEDKIWSILGFKGALQRHIKGIGETLAGMRNEQLAVRAKTKRTMSKLKEVNKDIKYLHKQLEIRNRRKFKAYQWILEIKQQDQIV